MIKAIPRAIRELVDYHNIMVGITVLLSLGVKREIWNRSGSMVLSKIDLIVFRKYGQSTTRIQRNP